MDPMVQHVDVWRPYIKDVLQSKVSELKLLGYDAANETEVWECLKKKVWKKEQEKPLFQVVQDILHLSGNIYMSYLTVQSQQHTDLMAQIEALTSSEKQ
ncbi:histidine kinase [Tenuibacillus multivorans]|uniref:Post-transcriptional regulator n=2 Tax=Tenuibacillus multivorans TaxID=237069 RepID=A0A1G9ZJ05_9BACI|nr:histidine kinase [Tenuibacillus multivorans]SDN21304.1 Post-transcriptional regulator [Tenuibacillus multivorans]